MFKKLIRSKLIYSCEKFRALLLLYVPIVIMGVWSSVVACFVLSKYWWDANITVTSQWALRRPKSPGSRLFVQPFVQAHIKENIKASRHWPLQVETTGDPWFPSQRARDTENFSFWWRHHEYCRINMILTMTGVRWQIRFTTLFGPLRFEEVWSEEHTCWWPDDTRCQDSNSHGMGLVPYT